MAVAERPDLKRVEPGIYKSTHDARTVQITPDDLVAMERHARVRRLKRAVASLFHAPDGKRAAMA